MKYIISILAVLSLQACSSAEKKTEPMSAEMKDVARVVQENLRSFIPCYDDKGPQGNNTSINLKVGWKIVKGGVVKDAKIKEKSVQWKSLETCMVKVVSSLKFKDPGPENAVEIVYPFLFKRLEKK